MNYVKHFQKSFDYIIKIKISPQIPIPAKGHFSLPNGGFKNVVFGDGFTEQNHKQRV